MLCKKTPPNKQIKKTQQTQTNQPNYKKQTKNTHTPKKNQHHHIVLFSVTNMLLPM